MWEDLIELADRYTDTLTWLNAITGAHRTGLEIGLTITDTGHPSLAIRHPATGRLTTACPLADTTDLIALLDTLERLEHALDDAEPID